MAEPVAELWQYEEAPAPEQPADVLADTGATRVLIEREALDTAEALSAEPLVTDASIGSARPLLAPAPTVSVSYLDYPMPEFDRAPEINGAGERTV
jgi:hypothetical protein